MTDRIEIPSRAPASAWDAVEHAKPTEPTAPPLVPREIPVDIKNWRDPDKGAMHSCTVTSCVMGEAEKARFTLACADMAGARLWDSLPRGLQARIGAQVRCALQIKGSPDWLRKALGEDDDLLFAIEEVLVSHETRFRRGDYPAGGIPAPTFRLVAAALDTPGTDAPAD